MTTDITEAGGAPRPLFVSVTEAARLAGLGETSIREAANRGDLEVRWYGNGKRQKRLIGYASLEEWLYGLPLEPAA